MPVPDLLAEAIAFFCNSSSGNITGIKIYLLRACGPDNDGQPLVEMTVEHFSVVFFNLKTDDTETVQC